MSKSESAPEVARPPLERNSGTPNPVNSPAAEILPLLSDEYTRKILNALAERPLAARELVTRLDVSRATVYRRLDDLESAGVVVSSMTVHPEGHHRKRFRVAVDEMNVTFGTEGVRVEAHCADDR
mgnify:FL=1